MLPSFQNWWNSFRENNSGATVLVHTQPQPRPSDLYRHSSRPDGALLSQEASMATVEQGGRREIYGREYFNSLSPTAIYEDRFVRVTASTLRIKCYWFPLCSSRDIHLDSIHAVFWRTLNENDDHCSTVPWLLSCTDGTLTWWACDCDREWGAVGSCTIRLELGEASLKGFSVVNLNKFLIALEAALSPNIPVIEDL